MSVLAAVAHANVALLFLILAILAFVVALYLAFTGRALEAIVAAFIGVVIVLLT